MPADRVVQLAQLAGVDPADYLILIASEQTSGATHRAWESVIKRLAIAAILLTPVLGYASPQKQLDSKSMRTILSVQSIDYAK